MDYYNMNLNKGDKVFIKPIREWIEWRGLDSPEWTRINYREFERHNIEGIVMKADTDGTTRIRITTPGLRMTDDDFWMANANFTTEKAPMLDDELFTI